MKLIRQPGSPVRVGEWLLSNLGDPKWSEFRSAVAFAKTSGVMQISDALFRFSERGRVKLSVGIDALGTSFEALKELLESVGSTGEVWIFHHEANHLFHPKVYLFRNNAEALALIGSNNLTGGGLFTNYELAVEIPFDLSVEGDLSSLAELEELLDGYCDQEPGTARRLDPQFLDDLLAKRYVLREAEIASSPAHRPAQEKGFFKSPPLPPPPRRPRRANQVVPMPPSPTPEYRGFVMTLQRGDAGHGQLTPGTSPRAPEIFLPVAAVRDAAPDFWGWDLLFVPDPEEPERKTRHVSVHVNEEVVTARIWRNPDKHDFRLGSEAIRRAIKVGGIVHVEKAPPDSIYDYDVEGIAPEDPRYEQYRALCVNPVRNSPKRWGYYV